MKKNIYFYLGTFVLLTLGCAQKTTAPKPEVDYKHMVTAAFEKIQHEKTASKSEISDIKYSDLLYLDEAEDYHNKIQLRLIDNSLPELDLLKDSLIVIDRKSLSRPWQELVELHLEENQDLTGKMELFCDDNQLLFSVPNLTDRIFLINYQDDLVRQIDESPYFGMILKEHPDLDVMRMVHLLKNQKSDSKILDTPEFLTSYWQQIKRETSLIDKGLAEMTVIRPEQMTADLQEYIIDISSAVFGEIIFNIWDLYNEEVLRLDGWDQDREFVKDLLSKLDQGTVKVYLDNREQISALKSEHLIVSDQQVYNLKLEINLNNDCSIEVLLEGDNEIIMEFNFRQAKKNQTELFEISYLHQFPAENTLGHKYSFVLNSKIDLDTGGCEVAFNRESKGVLAEVNASGQIEGFRGEEWGAVRVDSLYIKTGEEWVILQGECLFKPLTEEINPPEGRIMDTLSASQQEWTIVVAEVYDKVMRMIEEMQ